MSALEWLRRELAKEMQSDVADYYTRPGSWRRKVDKRNAIRATLTRDTEVK